MRLDEELLAEAKQFALARGRTLTSVLEEALRDLLRRPKSPLAEPQELPTFGHGGLRPGVDLDDSAALLEVLEGDAAS